MPDDAQADRNLNSTEVREAKASAFVIVLLAGAVALGISLGSHSDAAKPVGKPVITLASTVR